MHRSPFYKNGIHRSGIAGWSPSMPDLYYSVDSGLSIGLVSLIFFLYTNNHLRTKKGIQEKKDPVNIQDMTHHSQGKRNIRDEELELQETRRNFYGFKILDLFWFEGQLPDNPMEIIHYYFNDDWPTKETPMPVTKIMSLSEGDLLFICQRLKRPVWAHPPCLRGELGLGEVSFLFDGIKEYQR